MSKRLQLALIAGTVTMATFQTAQAADYQSGYANPCWCSCTPAIAPAPAVSTPPAPAAPVATSAQAENPAYRSFSAEPTSAAPIYQPNAVYSGFNYGVNYGVGSTASNPSGMSQMAPGFAVPYAYSVPPAPASIGMASGESYRSFSAEPGAAPAYQPAIVVGGATYGTSTGVGSTAGNPSGTMSLGTPFLGAGAGAFNNSGGGTAGHPSY